MLNLSGDVRPTHFWQWQEWMKKYKQKASKQPVSRKNTVPDVFYIQNVYIYIYII